MARVVSMRAMALIVFTLLMAITASPVVAQPKVGQVRPARIYKASTGPLKTPAGSGTKASPSQSRGGRWTHALFEKVRGEVQRSAHALLHDRHDAPLVLPLEVNIVLVGFDGDGGYRYRADAEALETFLRQSFGHFRPSSMSTGRPLEVSIELHYNVVHAGTNHLRTIESAISHSAEPADDEPPPHPWGDVSSTNDDNTTTTTTTPTTSGGARTRSRRRVRWRTRLISYTARYSRRSIPRCATWSPSPCSSSTPTSVGWTRAKITTA